MAEHQTVLHFQAAFAMPNGSLKRLRHSNGKEWVWRRYAMFCFKLCEGLGQPEKQSSRFAVSGCLVSIRHFGDEPLPLHLGFAKRYFRLPHPSKAA
ncbi:hypothetical protein [Kingella oralis]|uniref:hypothetical protein n=1 Tax=Kingella oralis TaxID=505 RepID=UPI002D80B810|nr:hypothetical protein [Kingella oralis]